jgi:TM2 domain-containing membrane protein YozV
MNCSKILLFFSLLILNKILMANNTNVVIVTDTSVEFFDSLGTNSENIDATLLLRPNPIFKLLREKQNKKKQLIATILAFPLPFGIVGLHRIYLNCAPYVPVAYIASLGGVFGILPFIDFWVLLTTNDVENFSKSKKIFMWIK